MYDDQNGHQGAGISEAPFECYARQALREAIIAYGWDHPVVSAAERSLMEIRRADCA